MNWKKIQSFRDLSLLIDKIFYQALMRRKTDFIMQKDWDNLIILDACRYDMFAEMNTIPGDLSFIYSRGSSTGHFLIENFKERTYLDTVYVTANPLVNYYAQKSFFLIIPVWKDGWNEKYQTVLPDNMVKSCLEARRKYPDKRMIFHFMQPHFPFLDEDIRQKIGEHEGILSRNLFLGGEVEHVQTVWNKFRKGRLTEKTVRKAYRSNLKIVLEHVAILIKELRGKSVITSDHANLFGERLYPLPLKEYGHPGGLYKKSLLKVPWLVSERGERKKITKAQKRITVKDLDPRSKEFIRKLSPLGYI